MELFQQIPLFDFVKTYLLWRITINKLPVDFIII